MIAAGIVVVLVMAILFNDLKKRKDRSKKSDLAKRELADHLKSFSGAINVLYCAAKEGDDAVVERLFKQWNKRLSDKPELSACFRQITDGPLKESYSAVGRAWIGQLEEWGLQHGEEGEIITIDEDTSSFYILDDVYENGDQARILYPCWYLVIDGEKRVAEKGAAALIYGQEDE